MNGIWVFIETWEGVVRPVSYELLGAARKLSETSGASVCAVVLAGAADNFNSGLIAHGADAVLWVRDARLAQRSEVLYPQVLAQLAQRYQPAIFLIGATAFGRSIAPRIASRLDTGLTADCTGLAMDAQTGLLLQTRPAFGGNLMATIVCRDKRPQMATVRPGVMAASLPDWTRVGRVVEEQVQLPAENLLEVLQVARLEGGQTGLSTAKMVVSVGRGIGGPQAIGRARQLAERLGAGLGASRAVVDLGWLPYGHQVGQTGISVAPKVYLALGVSGAVQHLAGVSADTFLIAVNRDAQAPIFSRADLGVVGDCGDVLEALLQALGE